MKLKDVVNAYMLLGSAKIKTLSDEEAFELIKARLAMKGEVEKFETLRKELVDQFKPENYDEVQRNIANLEMLTDEQKLTTQKVFFPFKEKVERMLTEELEKESSYSEKIGSLEMAVKLIKENGWEMAVINSLESLIG